MRLLLPVLACGFLASLPALAQESLTAAQAAQHVNEFATVCGTVASATYARTTNGQPTFVNLDKAWPHPVFTVVVWNQYRTRFETPPEQWKGHLCVSGRITAYKGTPEIKVSDPTQVSH